MRFVQLTKYILSRKAFSIMYNSLRRIYFPPSLSSIMAYNTILAVIISIFILTLQYCVKMQQMKSDVDRGGRSIEVCTCWDFLEKAAVHGCWCMFDKAPWFPAVAIFRFLSLVAGLLCSPSLSTLALATALRSKGGSIGTQVSPPSAAWLSVLTTRVVSSWDAIAQMTVQPRWSLVIRLLICALSFRIRRRLPYSLLSLDDHKSRHPVVDALDDLSTFIS